jgi:membrane-associated phospholipid phosphatase
MTKARLNPSGHAASSSTWVLSRGVMQTWHRFRADWSDLPVGSFKRWAWTIMFGMLLCLGLMTGLALAGRQLLSRGMAKWDERILLSIEHSPISIQSAILLESPGNFLYLIPVTVLSVVLAVRTQRPILAMTFAAAYLLARPLFLLGFALWDRPRPRLILGGLAAPPFDSFPSGHVVQAIAIYGLLAYLWASRSSSIFERIMIATFVILWIATVAVARIRLGAHWPSDVIAGAVVGVTWLTVLITAMRSSHRGQAPERPTQSAPTIPPPNPLSSPADSL